MIILVFHFYRQRSEKCLAQKLLATRLSKVPKLNNRVQITKMRKKQTNSSYIKFGILELTANHKIIIFS